MLYNYLKLLNEIGLRDFLDIGLATVFLALAIHVLRSARARAVLTGLISFTLIFFFSRQFELKVTIWILQGIAAVLVLLLIVVFQAEMRRFLEHFPSRLRLRRGELSQQPPETADLIAEALGQLSDSGRGGLLILPGQDQLEPYMHGGIRLNGILSKAIILSIFDPNSPGHDGALLVRGDRVESFGLRLPLSQQQHQLQDRGTRHAAALGLSEQSDAFVIAVSEETSRISYAYQGELHTLKNPQALAQHIHSFFKQHDKDQEETRWQLTWFGWHIKDLFLALLCAIGLWLFIVPSAVVEKVTYQVPIIVQNIPEDFKLTRVVPDMIEITLTGERRNLFQIKQQDLTIRLDGTLTRFGRKTYPISKSLIFIPPEVEILEIQPEEVMLYVEKL